MSARHRRPVVARSVNKRVIGAGAAGLAAALSLAPLAQADPAAPTTADASSPAVTDAPSTDAPSTDAPSSDAPSTDAPSSDTPASGAPSTDAPKAKAKVVPAASTSSDPVQAQFGYQKIRVGVQIKSGAWVPPGTTTVNTRLRIIETGPGVDGKKVTLCFTEADTATTGDDPTATFCRFDNETEGPRAIPAVVVSPGPSDLDADAYYDVRAGDKVRVFQTTVNDGLLRDTETGKVAPCTVPNDSPPYCDGATDVLFVDPGLPPLAVDDTASTASGQSVSIDVLANDEGQGAPETVDSATDPGHGSAHIVSGSPDTVTYTPDAGFSGTDTFDYTMSTPNGVSTATVTVTVPAPPTSSTATPPPTSQTPPPAAPQGSGLSNTGVPASALEDLAAALLLAGGAATVVGRRRYRGRHV